MRIKNLISCQIKGIWGDEPKNDGYDTSVIKTNNMSYEGDIDYSSIVLRSIPLAKAKDNYLKKGDLLIEKSGGTKTHSVGYVNYFDGKNDTYVCNNFILGIRPNSQIVDSRFLFWQLRYNYEKGYFKSCASKTTGIQNLKVNDYLNKEIKFIDSKAKQSLIAKQLDSINREISAKKAVINNLDSLVKSLFVEMFGDPMDSSKSNRFFTECCIFNPKKSEVANRKDDECSFVPMECVGIDGSFRIKNNGLIKDYYKGYTYFKNGDVLLAKITPCFENGKTAIAENCINGIGFGTTEFHVCRCIEGISNPQWIKYLLKNDALHNYATTKMTGSAGQKRIQTPFFEKLRVYLPPIELQNKFASIVSLIDKSRFVCHSRYFLWLRLTFESSTMAYSRVVSILE